MGSFIGWARAVACAKAQVKTRQNAMTGRTILLQVIAITDCRQSVFPQKLFYKPKLRWGLTV